MKDHTRISEIRADLESGVVTCAELVEGYLDRIDAQPELNAFLEVWADEAREQARRVDSKVKSGQAGRLAGVVIALKDVLAYEGHKVSASSKILEGFTSIYTGTAVQRLLDEDAILIGRTNCDEFAMGASNENSAYGVVLNAADKSRVPGGSSGGSAVAVQAGLCHASLGTDTGGSIRQPAAFTGLVGMKPTYGLVSRWGLLAYASSFDQIGPITKSVEDNALILEIMAGPDANDSTVSQRPKPHYEVKSADRKFRFGIMQEAVEHPGLDPFIRDSVYKLADQLGADGHEVGFFHFPLLDYMVPAYYILTTAEASSNLSRYSGLMYGYRSPDAHDLESTYIYSRTQGFGQEVKRRIMLGTFVLSSDYYDAYYKKGQQVRRIIRQKTEEILGQFDAILLPTTSTPAFRLGEKSKDPVAMYLADLFTVQANLAGNPAISIPWNSTPEGLPTGMQLMCNHFEEQKLYELAKTLEKYK
ncbi:MAG: Asp-tRNA(Asn)/Glu-tRNA(Gln) amidotransferase subunit GatA [Bacteroidetes bacterium]|nr:Asp-tRNA(Asn)/Glu-tRNA(Gln) amidotransferase subunit GatA [Bacteroidota bacterium]